MLNTFNESAFKQNQGPFKMELAKLSAIGGLVINMFLYLSAWFANLDSIKSTILFIAALAMSMYRFYRWTITSRQNKELKDIQIRREDLEIRRQELDVIERENRLIRENL